MISGSVIAMHTNEGYMQKAMCVYVCVFADVEKYARSA